MTTKETLKAMYDAFGKGNIPFVLETISEDFNWLDSGDPSVIPFGGVYKGKAEMMNFFQKLGGSIDTTLWQVDNYIGEADIVVAEGKQGIRSKTTGKDAVIEWIMVWKFKNGIPVSGRSYYNTASIEKAFIKN